MRKNFKLLGAVAIAGVVAATGSAFTASNTLNGDNVAGYNTDVVSGATTSSIEHTLGTDGTTITSTALTFSTSQADNTVKAGFGSTLFPCAPVVVAEVASTTSYTCTYTTPYTTSSSNSFAVAVN